MQIIDKNGVVSVKLTQNEGRRIRDAAYFIQRIAINLTDAERSEQLKAAGATILTAANEFCPSTDKLDKQDEQEPPFKVPE